MKSLIYILLAIVLLLPVQACSSAEENVQDSQARGKETAAPAVEKPTVESAESSGSEGGDIPALPDEESIKPEIGQAPKTGSEESQMGEGAGISPKEAASIPDSADKINPLAVGSMVPKVELTTIEGTAFDLGKEIQAKPSILIFYRGGWCPVSNTHLSKIQAIGKDLSGLGYQVLAISPDKPELLSETIDKNMLTFSLLSDSSMKAATAFGLAFRVDEKTMDAFMKDEIDLEAASGQTHHLLPVPAVFILGTDGNIKFSHVDPDHTKRMEADALLEEAKKALDAVEKQAMM